MVRRQISKKKGFWYIYMNFVGVGTVKDKEKDKLMNQGGSHWKRYNNEGS